MKKYFNKLNSIAMLAGLLTPASYFWLYKFGVFTWELQAIVSRSLIFTAIFFVVMSLFFVRSKKIFSQILVSSIFFMIGNLLFYLLMYILTQVSL